ncbi:MAG: hypothetical protein RLZZ612_2332, partial [Pseudomonadota bacterium]
MYEIYDGKLPDGTTRINSNSVWDIASEKYVSEAKGNFRIIAGGVIDEMSVFVKSELPALLKNIYVETIDGVPRSALAELPFENAKKAINYQAAKIAHFSQLSLSNIDFWLKANDTTMKAAFANESLHTSWVAGLKNGALGTMLDSSLANDLKGLASKLPSLEGWGKALGPIAVGAVLLVAATKADAAEAQGNSDQAKEIMKEAVIDLAGSTLLQIGAGFVAGLGAAAVVSAGIISAPIAGALVLGAALAGGFFGGDLAVEFYRLLDDRDNNGQRDILDKLENLLFGATSTLTTPLPADLNGNKYTIDADLSREQLIANAKDSIAWRYALREFNAFVITDVDYSAQNTHGSLDLYATNPAGMTDEYLADRAAMMTWKLQFDRKGARDDNDAVRSGSKPYNETWDSNTTNGNWDFIDMGVKLQGGSPLHLAIDGVGVSLYDHQVVFGSKGADTIKGSGDSDRLYGMSGNDQLDGSGGNDYLEGNTGNDTLIGGAGSDELLGGAGDDTYQLQTADSGIDSLRDGQGQDKIEVNGTQVQGVFKPQLAGGSDYYSADNRYQLRELDADTHTWRLSVQDTATGNYKGLADLQGWQSGDYGLSLGTVPAPAERAELSYPQSVAYMNMDATGASK